jgi:hypothetical protein
MLYGNRSSRNQILKYQSAIDQDIIDGATIEVSGRIDPKALDWLNGTAVGERGPAPDVELLYTMPLPSGADYTFVLKRAENNRGLRYFNDDRTYTDEDRRIVAGIYKAIQDGSIGQLISDTHIEDPALRRLIKDPFYIQDVDLLRRYNEERTRVLNTKLLEKAASDQVNGERTRDSVSEYNTRSYIENTTRQYQDHLQQKPDTSRTKQTYLLGAEQAIENVTDRAYQRAQEIRAYEIARGNSPEEAERRLARAGLGYTGQPEGTGLDMDHIILDAIQEENKTAGRRGRQYDQPERFMDVSQLQDYLGSQDRRATDIRIFDPLTGTETVQSQVPLSQVKQIQRFIEGQNLERAREIAERNDQRLLELRVKPIHARTSEEKVEFRKLSMLPRYHGNKQRGIREPAEQELQFLTSGAKQSSQMMGDSLSDVPQEQRAARIEDIRREKEASDTAIDESRARLRQIYTHILGGEMAWLKMAKAASTDDNDLVKFRYVVTPEGAMPVAQVGLKGEIPAGGSYSELARGRNVYGAGELVFKRDAETGNWGLQEINNSSPQYPVSAEGTLGYVRNLVQQAGIDASQTDIFDARQRGIRLRDQHLIGPEIQMGRTRSQTENVETKPAETAKPDRFGYTGFFLDDASMSQVRGDLTINGASAPPRWTPPEKLHITEKFGVRESDGLPPNKSVKVVGHAVDEKGVEALVVSVDGQTTRADKRPYHLTRSLGEGRKASESMATVEKAMAIDKARAEGDLSKFSAEDIARYRYTPLRPEEQFKLGVQPKFEPTQETKAKEKPKKAEVPFEEMPPRQQAATALKATPREYLDKTISTRTPENRMGSYWEMTPEQLKRAIHTADWKPFEDKDGVIKAPARAYQATIPGGRLGMTTLDAVPPNAKLYLVDPKRTGNWSLATSGAAEPVTDKATLILGPGDDGKMMSWTFHPGDPVRPSNLDSAKLQSILGDLGINTDTTRIEISRAELDKINSQLPADQQMTMVKLETQANTSH